MCAGWAYSCVCKPRRHLAFCRTRSNVQQPQGSLSLVVAKAGITWVAGRDCHRRDALILNPACGVML